MWYLFFHSANGSDRYGACKWEGSRVINMALDLCLQTNNNTMAQPPIEAQLQLLSPEHEHYGKIVLHGYNDMLGTFAHFEQVIDKPSVLQLFAIANVDQISTVSQLQNAIMSDTQDMFRMYKYVLYFLDLTSCKLENLQDYLEQVWQQVMQFSQGHGFLWSLSNKGPSCSGFSSSSAVMTTLLTMMYTATCQHDKLQHVHDWALLAENKMGLRSGWNDTYTLKAGMHHYTSMPTTLVPVPIDDGTLSSIPMENFVKRVALVHTGLQRKATGRMNRRHEVYLSKDEQLYPYLLQSFNVHDEMVHALQMQDFNLLGKLCTEYMQCRVAFDADATSEYLNKFFEELIVNGVIEGGLLSGT